MAKARYQFEVHRSRNHFGLGLIVYNGAWTRSFEYWIGPFYLSLSQHFWPLQ